MKAKTGAKKRFNMINEKKSIIINAFISVFFPFEIIKDDKKLKNRKVIKNWLLNNWDSKILKFKIWNISFVFSLWNNNGANITDDPFKKYKNSAIKNFSLKENTVSSFPKWKAAITRNNDKTVFGNNSQKIIIKRDIIT